MGPSSGLEGGPASESEAMVAGGLTDERMRILFATDGSESAGAALTFLQHLITPVRTMVRVVCVIPVYLTPYDEGGVFIDWDAVVRQERAGAEHIVQEAYHELAGKAIEISSVIREGDPAAEIIHAAEEWNADLVVIGSRGRGAVGGFLLGSVARDVARHCPHPVLVAHAPRGDLGQVIVATDGSEHARDAVAFANRLPLPPETGFTVLHVVRPYRWFTARPGLHHYETAEELHRRQHALAGRITAEARHSLEETGRRVQVEIREGDPAAKIHEAAEGKGADLIIVGARGVSPIRGLLIGSVADRLLTEAHASVLIVP